MRHGQVITDDYFWLREKSNPEVAKYLEAENAYTAAITKELQPFADDLYKEILGHIKQTDLDVPVRRGAYLYYSRTEEGKQYPIHCRKRGMEAPEEVLLDLNQLAQGKTFVGLGALAVSDDQNLLAYTLDYSGFRQYGLHVKDLRTGEVLADTTERVTSVEWAADNKTLFLTTEDETTKRSDTLWRHVVGSSSFDWLYKEDDELYDAYLHKTRDKKYILLAIVSTDTTEFRYVPAAEPQRDLAIFLPREKKRRYYVDHREHLFYIRTNRDKDGKELKDFEVVTVPEAQPGVEYWKPFIPAQDGRLVESIQLFKDFAISVEKSLALNHLRVHDFATGSWREIEFPEPVYSAFSNVNPEYDTKTFRYSYQSLITPPSIFEYDTTTGESLLLKQQEVLGGYDPKQYVSERLWATARDGVKIPLSVVYKKGFKRDATDPCFSMAMARTESAWRRAFRTPAWCCSTVAWLM